MGLVSLEEEEEETLGSLPLQVHREQEGHMRTQ